MENYERGGGGVFFKRGKTIYEIKKTTKLKLLMYRTYYLFTEMKYIN